MKTYLALDLGGTKLLIGEMDENGKILASKRYPSGYKNLKEGKEGILNNLRDYLITVGLKGDLVAAGMGLTGFIDPKKGLWRSLTHIILEEPVNLVELLSNELGVPAAIENDVRSATTAELILGCGKKTENFIYLNVGTGLAAGFVVDGHIARGAHNMAGEIGHTVVDMKNDTKCVCDRNGCCEVVISGIGFTAQANKLYIDYPDTKLTIPKDNKKVNGKELFELAKAGDKMCKRIVDEGLTTLTGLILNLLRFSDPDTIVLGGGIISSGEVFEELKKRLSEYSIMKYMTGGVILSSFNTDEVGLIGAGAVAMSIEKQL